MIELLDKSRMKPRSEIKNVPYEIIEFEMMGFARSSDKLLDYIRDSNPEISTKKAFTHILHDNGLHWEGCCCCNRDRHKYIEKLKIKKGI